MECMEILACGQLNSTVGGEGGEYPPPYPRCFIPAKIGENRAKIDIIDRGKGGGTVITHPPTSHLIPESLYKCLPFFGKWDIGMFISTIDRLFDYRKTYNHLPDCNTDRLTHYHSVRES